MGAVLGLAAAAAVGTLSADPTPVLLRSLYRYRVAAQTVAEAERLAAGRDGEAASQIVEAAREWRDERMAALRADLSAAIGENASDVFREFVAQFSSAEQSGRADFLADLSARVGLRPTPASYADLTRLLLDTLVADDLAASGRFLSELETWLDVRRRGAAVPPLSDWLARTAPPVPAVGSVVIDTVPLAPPARPRNPLRDAEAPASAFRPPGEEEAPGGLDTFGAARAARREKAVDEARAGMTQVAEERRAAEEEDASKRTAAAQAEAEARRKHAEKLAAAEAEALEQRKNSFAGRVKQVLTATISAAGGAFLGGIGSRAGEAAAEAVFKDR